MVALGCALDGTVPRPRPRLLSMCPPAASSSGRIELATDMARQGSASMQLQSGVALRAVSGTHCGSGCILACAVPQPPMAQLAHPWLFAVSHTPAVSDGV
jgi:hypothetical protein